LGDCAPEQYGTIDCQPLTPNLPIARSGYTAICSGKEGGECWLYVMLQLIRAGQGEVAEAVKFDFALLLHYKAPAGAAALKQEIERWASSRRCRDQRGATEISERRAFVFGPNLDDAFREDAENARKELASCRRGTIPLK
jgi:hypothetical protein